MRCFLCHRENFETIYKLRSKTILRCKNDGLFLVGNGLDRSLTYGEDYFSNPPNLSNSSYFLKKLETIRQALRRSLSRAKSRDSERYQNFKPKILDIGCGWGDFEEVLEKEKIPYLGIDTSQEAIEICRKKGLDCHQLSLNQLQNYKKQLTRNKRFDKLTIPSKVEGQISNNKSLNSKKFENLNIENWNLFGKLVDWNLEFDCITLFQVIEHLKNPFSLLKSAKKLLKPGGIVLITTPNHDSPLRKIFRARWSVYNEPSHFVFYNAKTLKLTLEKACFQNINIKLDQMRFLSSSYILNRLKQMYFPNFEFRISNFEFSLPIPTDRWGDLEAIAVK